MDRNRVNPRSKPVYSDEILSIGDSTKYEDLKGPATDSLFRLAYINAIRKFTSELTAQSKHCTTLPLSRIYTKLFDRFALKTTTRLSPKMKKSYCHNCYSVLPVIHNPAPCSISTSESQNGELIAPLPHDTLDDNRHSPVVPAQPLDSSTSSSSISPHSLMDDSVNVLSGNVMSIDSKPIDLKTQYPDGYISRRALKRLGHREKYGEAYVRKSSTDKAAVQPVKRSAAPLTAASIKRARLLEQKRTTKNKKKALRRAIKASEPMIRIGTLISTPCPTCQSPIERWNNQYHPKHPSTIIPLPPSLVPKIQPQQKNNKASKEKPKSHSNNNNHAPKPDNTPSSNAIIPCSTSTNLTICDQETPLQPVDIQKQE